MDNHPVLKIFTITVPIKNAQKFAKAHIFRNANEEGHHSHYQTEGL